MTRVLISAVGAFALVGLANAQYTQGFDDITTLPAAGWAVQNLSDSAALDGPLGQAWYQGNAIPNNNTNSNFISHAGADEAYMSTAWTASTAATSATLSNWLFTPVSTLQNGATLSFWTRTNFYGGTTIYPDRLEVRMSTNGSSTNVGSTSASVGDFSTVLLTINPTLTTTGYPTVWTQYTATVSGLGGPVSGRFAFRYFVTDGGPVGNNSGRIGLDTVAFTPVPEPATMAVLGVGVLAAIRRRTRK